MTIKLLVFAKLQEDLGLTEDSLDFLAGETAEQAFGRLLAKHGKTEANVSKQGVRVAVNEAFASWDTVLVDGDEVAFIPPVAGG